MLYPEGPSLSEGYDEVSRKRNLTLQGNSTEGEMKFFGNCTVTSQTLSLFCPHELRLLI